MTYLYPRDHRPNARKDQLAVGIMTSQRDAILFRVSGTSEDFIEMELVSSACVVIMVCGLVHILNILMVTWCMIDRRTGVCW
jgi:hypothetical protein